MKFTTWQEVEVTVELGKQELQEFIAEHWSAMDEDGFPVRQRVISVVTLLPDLTDKQLKSFSGEILARISELLTEQAARFQRLSEEVKGTEEEVTAA